MFWKNTRKGVLIALAIIAGLCLVVFCVMVGANYLTGRSSNKEKPRVVVTTNTDNELLKLVRELIGNSAREKAELERKLAISEERRKKCEEGKKAKKPHGHGKQNPHKDSVVPHVGAQASAPELPKVASKPPQEVPAPSDVITVQPKVRNAAPRVAREEGRVVEEEPMRRERATVVYEEERNSYGVLLVAPQPPMIIVGGMSRDSYEPSRRCRPMMPYHPRVHESGGRVWNPPSTQPGGGQHGRTPGLDVRNSGGGQHGQTGRHR